MTTISSPPKLTPTGDFVNGGISVTAALSITQPCTTLKTYSQSGKSFFSNKKLNLETVKKLYTGFGLNAASGAFAEGIAFTIYSLGKERLKDSNGNLSAKNNLFLSSTAGLLGSPCNSVLEQLMIRQQLYQGTIISHLKDTYRTGGIFRGVFKASNITAGRDIGFNIGVFALNDASKETLKPYIATPLIHEICSGLLSGAVAGFFTNPLDMIKTRIQGDLEGQHKTFLGEVKIIFLKKGIKGLFEGALSRTITVASLICGTILLKERIPNYFPSSLKNQ